MSLVVALLAAVLIGIKISYRQCAAERSSRAADDMKPCWREEGVISFHIPYKGS